MVRIYSLWYLIIFGYLLPCIYGIPLNTNERYQFDWKAFPFFLFFSFFLSVPFWRVHFVCVCVSSTLCKSFVNFISMLIYSPLWLYMSCRWLQFRKFRSSIGPGVNECARRENETVFHFTVGSLLLSVQCECVRVWLCIFAVYFYFVVRFDFFLSVSRSFFLRSTHSTTHGDSFKSMCVCDLSWKETDSNGKRCVCWWWFLSCFFCFARVSIGSRRKSWRTIFDSLFCLEWGTAVNSPVQCFIFRFESMRMGFQMGARF